MSIKLGFGKFKGWTLQQVHDDGEEGMNYLEWLINNTDTTDPKWGAKNKALVREAEQLLGLQRSAAPPVAAPRTPPARPAPSAARPVPGNNVKASEVVSELKTLNAKVQRLMDMIAKHLGIAPEIGEEEMQPDEEVPF